MSTPFKKPCHKQWKGCQIEYDGNPYTHILGIKEGCSHTEAFEALADKFIQVNGLIDQEVCCEDTPTASQVSGHASDIMTSVSSSVSRSSCYGKIGTTGFTYWMTLAGSGKTTFNWDIRELLNALPDGYEINEVEIAVYSVNGKLVTRTNANSQAGVSVPTADFPLTVQVTVPLTTPCGLMYLRQQVMVNSINSPKQGFLEINEAGGVSSAPMNQEQYNQFVYDKLSQVDQQSKVAGTVQVTNKENIAYQSKSIDYVADLHSSLINELINREQFVDEFTYQQTKTNLNAIISSLDLRIKETTTQIGVLSEQLSVLRSDLNSCCAKIDQGSQI
jgi:hypothetical protein